MSDSYWRIIPTDPTFIPGAEAQARAVEIVREMLGVVEGGGTRVTPEVEFIDQGEDLVSCPRCSAEIGVGWWQEAMDVLPTEYMALLEEALGCRLRQIPAHY